MIIPKQQINSAKKILVSAQCYLQKFIKFPDIGIFHSYAELLHAALLESNQLVNSFIPQPCKTMIYGRRYIPDCYVAFSNKREVIELKPAGKFNDAHFAPLSEFFDTELDAKFKVITNEEIFAQEQKALNWLFIIRVLVNNSHEITDNQECQLLKVLSDKPQQNLGDLIQVGNRMNSFLHELALFRLIHKGQVSINNDKDIDLNTEVSL